MPGGLIAASFNYCVEFSLQICTQGKEAEREGQTSSLVLSTVAAEQTRAIYLHILFVIISSSSFSFICHFGGPMLRNPAFWLQWVKSSSQAWLSNGKETGQKVKYLTPRNHLTMMVKNIFCQGLFHSKPFGHKDNVTTESVYDTMKGCCCLQCSMHFAWIFDLFCSVLALKSSHGFRKHKHLIIPLLKSVFVY